MVGGALHYSTWLFGTTRQGGPTWLAAGLKVHAYHAKDPSCSAVHCLADLQVEINSTFCKCPAAAWCSGVGKGRV